MVLIESQFDTSDTTLRLAPGVEDLTASMPIILSIGFSQRRSRRFDIEECVRLQKSFTECQPAGRRQKTFPRMAQDS
jgi:hypothetical protein